MKTIVLTFSMLLFLVFTDDLKAQNKKINWLNFQQLEDSLAIKPKKVFINFHTDWCVYCKKMDEAAFKDPEVIQKLNSEFYAVKMNSESRKPITFDGKIYTNKEIGKKRKPIHEIPLLLGNRKNKPFSLPLTILLDEKFKIIKRDFEYISPKNMINFLNQH
ncbi:thioredoxin family protein [uncultured Polaribacter sp.]|uniref:thioredoxin family protein n=1 Tax=uncultured Polaribacter sp. TaxID=174711 RepID=UPI002608EA0A|nr:thioredoxin family protein [uncultured Polaribacter sp.]